jgi:hypothetical protein
MDFLTSFPYWGIIVLVVVNALIVTRMDIRVDDDEDT